MMQGPRRKRVSNAEVRDALAEQQANYQRTLEKIAVADPLSIGVLQRLFLRPQMQQLVELAKDADQRNAHRDVAGDEFDRWIENLMNGDAGEARQHRDAMLRHLLEQEKEVPAILAAPSIEIATSKEKDQERAPFPYFLAFVNPDAILAANLTAALEEHPELHVEITTDAENGGVIVDHMDANDDVTASVHIHQAVDDNGVTQYTLSDHTLRFEADAEADASATTDPSLSPATVEPVAPRMTAPAPAPRQEVETALQETMHLLNTFNPHATVNLDQSLRAMFTAVAAYCAQSGLDISLAAMEDAAGVGQAASSTTTGSITVAGDATAAAMNTAQVAESPFRSTMTDPSKREIYIDYLNNMPGGAEDTDAPTPFDMQPRNKPKGF